MAPAALSLSLCLLLTATVLSASQRCDGPTLRMQKLKPFHCMQQQQIGKILLRVDYYLVRVDQHPVLRHRHHLDGLRRQKEERHRH